MADLHDPSDPQQVDDLDQRDDNAPNAEAPPPQPAALYHTFDDLFNAIQDHQRDHGEEVHRISA